MAENTTEHTESNNRVLVSSKVEPAIFEEVSRIAVEEDRSVSNVVNGLLKTHPRIQPVLEPATAASGN